MADGNYHSFPNASVKIELIEQSQPSTSTNNNNTNYIENINSSSPSTSPNPNLSSLSPSDSPSTLPKLDNTETHTIYTRSKCSYLTDCIFPCCKKVNMIHKRRIYINTVSSSSKNYTKFKNIIRNQKYSIITFIPLCLYNQFKFFNNQFYLLLAISQFFDEFKVGFLFSYIAPLVFVLVVTLTKEAIDDYKRYKRDKEQNTQKFTRIAHNGNRIINSADIRVGDLIEIHQHQRIPADIAILKSYDNNIYIKTDQLDGETDWKLRKPVPYFQHLKSFEDDVFKINCDFIIEPPNKSIYEFNGVLNVNNNNNINIDYSSNSLRHNDIVQQALNLENTIWMNAVLASKKIIGVVLYTGKETRAEMNSSQPKAKFGVLDKEINNFTKILFSIMLILSITILLLKGFTLNIKIDLITFVKFVVLLCSIIPISLKINMDIAKTFFSHQITSSKLIPGTIARNSTIPEELGRVDYIFSDKTGTLTQNEMVFKKIAMEIGTFQEENLPDLRMILNDECKVYNHPMGDLINMVNNNNNSNNSVDNIYESKKRIRRNQNKIIRDSITAITLCNNVTPIYNNETQLYEYQASSPDEIALVQFAEKINMKLTYRDDEKIILTNSNNYKEEYDILAIFPFSSESKRMGIVLNNKDTNQKIFYLKGAENVIEKLVKEDYISYIKENAEALASNGLRTLVICQKLLDENYYNKWIKVYKEALLSMNNRKEKINEAMAMLEKNMELLCVTGVEDKLQDEVSDTIESVKNAGIKVWMLTGDKVETATCIAISAGLKNKNQRMFCIKGISEQNEINEELEKIKYQSDFILIIDGTCLDLCLKYNEKLFFEVSMNANCVVCCRCTPTQKAKIITLIKKHTNKRCLAIGDGGNDVAMIQEAHVGVGIVGKEGKQASLSADFSINQFKDLKLLLLWYGRVSYKNTATIAHFVIHRGLTISFLQFIFMLLFYYLPIAIYNGNLILGYTTIYTALPVISLIFDQDTHVHNVIKFPSLYRELQKGREMSSKRFLWWFWKSLFQSSIIMVSAVMLFENIFIKIATVTFTCLIFAELLNVYIEIRKFHWVMIVSLGLTFGCYIVSLLFLKSILDFSYLSLENLLKICAVTLLSWLPFFSLRKVRKCMYPEAHEKLNLLKEDS